MPQQRSYHTNRTHPDETHKTEMDDLVDEAIAEAVARGESTVVEEAGDWLDDIDEALDEWASTAELAREFVAAYIQKGGE